MSHFCSFMEIVHKYCEDDPQIEELLKKNDLLQRENSALEAENEYCENEYMRLQIELFNIETMLKRRYNEKSLEASNDRLMETCTNIRHAISKIDFKKILQCNHMQMEQTYRSELQKLQRSTESLLKWHEKMEQRNVVQAYRKVELADKENEQNLQTNRSSMDASLRQNLESINKLIKERDTLIFNLTEGSANIKKMELLRELQQKYSSLRQTKAEMLEKLQAKEKRNFSATMPYKTRIYERESTPSTMPNELYSFNYDIPKFPSFNDILKSCSQDLPQPSLKPQITINENAGNVMLKSILRNAQDDSNRIMEINQPITTKHTKRVHFKMQLEERFEFIDETDSAISDSNFDDISDKNNEMPQSSPDKVVNEIEMIEAEDDVVPKIDLLTSSDDETSKLSETPEMKNREKSKSKVDILECVILTSSSATKTTFSDLSAEDKENIVPKFASNKKQSEEANKSQKHNDIIMPTPQTPAHTQEKRDVVRKSFYDEFLNASPLAETESDNSFDASTSRTVLKDFDLYINENSELKGFTQNEGNIKSSVTQDSGNGEVGGADRDIQLDFGTKELTFDSNDETDGDMFATFANEYVMDF